MKRLVIFSSMFFVLFLTSCARAPVREVRSIHTIEPYPVISQTVVTPPEALRGDVYHEVGPGETVWRLSKMYDVKMDDIVIANSLKDRARLAKGQELLIPNAAPLKAVIPFWPSKKWKYIIVHHSATDVGDALSFDKVHTNKRRWKGLGYHFVIDNGTSGKMDGQIEISPRWLHKENGAHCKASGMNYAGVGVCLVGNFSQDHVSEKQMNSLIFLVKELKKHYNIPDSRI
ncbi:MAG: N-acetylmuramoyl-L-alanine amidase, partial [Candidatus Omnitrophota bacterium]|nr:N-acetylmuramoyl-L-alanine amidase [Candidatus Omnitrophota bacterium]